MVVPVVDIWYGSKIEQEVLRHNADPVCIVAPGTDTATLFTLSTLIVFPCKGDVISFWGILFWLVTQMTSTQHCDDKIRPCECTERAEGWGCPLTPPPPLCSPLWRLSSNWGSVQLSSEVWWWQITAVCVSLLSRRVCGLEIFHNN